MARGRVLARVLLIVAGALACAPSSACARRETTAHATWLDPEPAPAVQGLGVRHGTPFRLADQRGKVVMLSFGYTSCLEVCPDTFSKARAVFRDLGDAAKDLEMVYVTVDPERDQPEPFRAFVAAVDPRFEGVFLEGEALSALLAAYHVTVRKRLPDPARYARRQIDPSAFYSMDHTSGFWMIDRGGRLRVRFAHEVDEAELLEGTRRLLAEKP